MSFIISIIHFLTLLLFIYSAACVLYLFFFSVASRVVKLKKYTKSEKTAFIALLIPAYKDDSVIVNTAKNALLQTYPADKFSVTVIADKLQSATIAELKQLPITVLEVSFEVSMKAKSLNAAFEYLPPNQYAIAMILDADNVMAIDCLEKVNHAYQDGWQVIQCHRTAKNKNTAIALLDAMSEEANNSMFRKGHRAVGLSCTLIGSGMAFEYNLLKDIFALPEIQNNPGEDREVDIQLIKKKIMVEYIDDAFVYDEKVQRVEVFEKQRTRWLGAQIVQIGRFFKPDLLKMAASITYLNKCFQNFLLPRLLLVSLFSLLFFVAIVDAASGWRILAPSWPLWISVCVLFALTMLLAIPNSFYSRQTFKALLKVPSLAFAMMKALLGFKENKKGFLHTPKEFSK